MARIKNALCFAKRAASARLVNRICTAKCREARSPKRRSFALANRRPHRYLDQGQLAQASANGEEASRHQRTQFSLCSIRRQHRHLDNIPTVGAFGQPPSVGTTYSQRALAKASAARSAAIISIMVGLAPPPVGKVAVETTLMFEMR